MSLFAEVDVAQTVQNAKRRLKAYPRLREIAHDRFSQKITQTYSFELRQPHGRPSRPVEKLAIAKVDAQRELDGIEEAVNQIIQPERRLIIIEKYLKDRPSQDFEIYTALGYEKTRYYELLELALLSFAHTYRNGQLVVYQAE